MSIKIKSWLRLFVGILLMFLFTQIQWGDYFFPIKKMKNEEIDNTALFYTESEAAGDAAFYLRKLKDYHSSLDSIPLKN